MTLAVALCLTLGLCQANSAPVGLKSSTQRRTEVRAPGLAREQSGVREAFAGVKATFLLKEVGGKLLIDLDPKRSQTAFPPCSTFKIMNSLVGLETGVLKGTSDRFKWDGVKRERAEANRDQTLESAFKDSIVWVYQDIARRIGPTRMQRALDAAKYGNRDISRGIDKFWLMSSLKISPRNQLAFVETLYTDSLPFSKRAQATVRGLMLQESKPNWEFSGKTGSGIAPDETRLGWFVGSVKKNGKRYVFVACIEGPKGTSGYTARSMTRKALDLIVK